MFWSTVDKLLLGISNGLCLILSINGFNSFFSFKGLKIEENILQKLTEQIHKINENSHVHEAFVQTFKMNPQQFEMLEGYKYSISRIFDKLNVIDDEEFNRLKNNVVSEQNLQYEVMRRNAGPLPPLRHRQRLEMLDEEDDYMIDIQRKLLNVMFIIDPNVTNFDFQLTHQKRNQKKTDFLANCFLCNFTKSISVCAYVSNSYLRVSISNYVRHLKTHPGVTEKLEQSQVTIIIFSFIYIMTI